MHDDESIQPTFQAPLEPEPPSHPEAPAETEDTAPPLQSLRLPSALHPVQPWITGEQVAVVNRGMRLWFLGMWREPLITGLIAVAVAIAGGAVQVALDPNLDMGKVLAAAPIIGIIVFCFSTGMPSEIRITDQGVGVLDWRESAHGWPGRFFQNGTQAQFTMVASGTYFSAPGREPVRVRLPRFAVARAARSAGLRLERAPSYWIWMLLSWPGLFLWCALQFQTIGGSMMLVGLVVRTFARLRSGEAEEDLLTRP